LAAINLDQVRNFLGPEIQELHAKIKQAIFRRLSEFNKQKVNEVIETILTTVDLKVADSDDAQKMFAKKLASYE
jgi:hypothetical protein